MKYSCSIYHEGKRYLLCSVEDKDSINFECKEMKNITDIHSDVYKVSNVVSLLYVLIREAVHLNFNREDTIVIHNADDFGNFSNNFSFGLLCDEGVNYILEHIGIKSYEN